jgi:hypothetical protein
MQKRVQKLTENDLVKYPIRDLIDGWFFRVDEVSQGYYQVEGIDRWGRTISRMGIDPVLLLSLCKSDVEEMKLS